MDISDILAGIVVIFLLSIFVFMGYTDNCREQGTQDGYNQHNSIKYNEFNKYVEETSGASIGILISSTRIYDFGYISGCNEYYQKQAVNNYYNKSV